MHYGNSVQHRSRCRQERAHPHELLSEPGGVDTTTAASGIETVVEDLDALKYDVGEIKDLLNNNKGELNHVRRIVRRALSDGALGRACSGSWTDGPSPCQN